jgi:hypothetical protein
LFYFENDQKEKIKATVNFKVAICSLMEENDGRSFRISIAGVEKQLHLRCLKGEKPLEWM